MSPQITLNQENCDMKFIPQDGEIDNQIIVKLYNWNSIAFTWNFNPDNEEDVMGTCGYSDVFMQLAGCGMHKWYKRFAYTDPEPQIIIKEMSQQEIDSYMSRREEQPLSNNTGNNPQNGCRTNSFHNANTNDIVMTFE